MDDTSIECRLLNFLRDSFLGGEASGLGFHDPLVEWGILNSMRSLRYVAWIQKEFGATVSAAPDEEVLQTIAKTAAYIRAALGTTQ